MRLGSFASHSKQGKKLQRSWTENAPLPILQGAPPHSLELHKAAIHHGLSPTTGRHFLNQEKLGAIVHRRRPIDRQRQDTQQNRHTTQRSSRQRRTTPFFIVRPQVSTFDLSIPDGEHIPIAERRRRRNDISRASASIHDTSHAAHPAFDAPPPGTFAASSPNAASPALPTRNLWRFLPRPFVCAH